MDLRDGKAKRRAHGRPTPVIAAVLAAAAVVISVLAWAILLRRDDGSSSTGSSHRTGDSAIDNVIDALLRQDIDELVASVQMAAFACSSEQIVGSPPRCPPGEPDGTQVDAFSIGYCEGTYATKKDEVRAAVGAAISIQPGVAVYAVLVGDGADASNGYTVAVTADAPSQATAPVSFWHLNKDGRVTGLQHECGAYGAAQQVEYRFPDPQFVFEPIMNCQPGPGEVANLLVVVAGFSPGSIRPQFVGSAASTLGVPTGERAIVDVLPHSQWIGSITRLDDVRSGMELQAVGRRDENCIIQAETILSPGSVSIRSTQFGFEATYPYGWIEGAVPFPYASCVDCVTLGPRDVPHPYGIQIYTQPSDPGCDPACYFGIRGIAVDAPRNVTINGLPGSTQEIERQAPLGLAADTGDDTPYRQIATVFHRQTHALLIVGFFREGDPIAEERTRAALDAFLASIRFMDSAPDRPN